MMSGSTKFVFITDDSKTQENRTRIRKHVMVHVSNKKKMLRSSSTESLNLKPSKSTNTRIESRQATLPLY